MTVQEFYNRYRNIFPFIFSGTIEFFGKEDVIEKKISKIGTPYNHLKVQRRVLGTEIFDHYYDLVSYSNYQVIESIVTCFTNYSVNNEDDFKVQYSIVLKVYGEKFDKEKYLDSLSES